MVHHGGGLFKEYCLSQAIWENSNFFASEKRESNRAKFISIF